MLTLKEYKVSAKTLEKVLSELEAAANYDIDEEAEEALLDALSELERELQQQEAQ